MNRKDPCHQYKDITGLILVGGKSKRMGQDKAFLNLDGRPLMEPVINLFSNRFDRLLLSGDRSERFINYSIPVIPDIYPGSSLGGIHAGLLAAATERIFVAPCDLPYPDPALLDHICSLSLDSGHDAIVPLSPQGYEPLYALYSKACLDPIRALLENGECRIVDLFRIVRTLFIQGEELASIVGTGQAFLNINTPAEFESLAGSNPDRVEMK